MAADLFEVKCVTRTSSNGSPWTLVSGGPDIIIKHQECFYWIGKMKEICRTYLPPERGSEWKVRQALYKDYRK